MPASSLGADPAVISHSETIRGIGVLRAVVDGAFKQHFMHHSSLCRPRLAFA
jgi:hypothetical protein